jgi:hypothetical protein
VTSVLLDVSGEACVGSREASSSRESVA